MIQIVVKTTSGLALAITLLLASLQVPVSGQNGKGRRIEGSWTTQVTLRNCQTGDPIRTFQVMNTFMQGGTMQQYSNDAAPSTRGPSHGVWRHEGGNDFTFSFQFFRFNADGSYAGFVKGTRQVEVEDSRNNYTGAGGIEIYNASGVLIGTGCTTETATRFE